MDIKDMTLAQKIGQMLMVGFHSLQFDSHVKELLYDYHIGNIILFSRNVANKDQIAGLTEEIQKNAIRATGIPALIHRPRRKNNAKLQQITIFRQYGI